MKQCNIKVWKKSHSSGASAKRVLHPPRSAGLPRRQYVFKDLVHIFLVYYRAIQLQTLYL